MSAIKSKNTKPELRVRKVLHGLGLRYRIHDKNLPGKPDLVFKKYKTVVFVNGCFWHGHQNCKDFRLPKTNTEWWREKISKTIERDSNKTFQLKQLGWKVLTIWECEISEEFLVLLANKIKV